MAIQISYTFPGKDPVKYRCTLPAIMVEIMVDDLIDAGALMVSTKEVD